MKKKILILIVTLLFLTSCNNINQMSIEDIINGTISNESSKTNINNKGYKYFLPSSFSVLEDNDYVQKLLSNDNIYYLNIDVVSYYYKSSIQSSYDKEYYKYYTFGDEDNNGYVKITKNSDNFFIELCYNYAIIEVEVKDSELRYAISNGISILNSIQYNDLIIEKYILENDLKSVESEYKIPEPTDKDSNQNILQYIEDDEEDTE